MSLVSGFAWTAILATFVYFIFKKLTAYKLPPGPWGYPIVGNLLQLGALPHIKLQEWVSTYGKIFTVYFGSERLIVLSDVKIIREAFQSQSLSGRMDLESMQLLSLGPYGIINSENDDWNDQRRFALRTLRDLGFGKKTMEGLIMDEVNEFLDYMGSSKGQPFDPQRRFNICFLNMIWGILSSGNRVNHDDAKFVSIFDRQKELVEELAKSGTLFNPSLAKLIPKYSKWDKIVILFEEMRQIFQDHVKEHKKTIDEDPSNTRDFIDVYLNEIKSTKNTNSSFYKETGEKSLLAVMGDFFAAGPDTTSSTMSWSLLYLSKFPHVQTKVQNELDAIVGQQRQPSLGDRVNLPYTVATIEEILRMSCIVPMGVFHRALSDVKFHGYDIPKGTWVCPNHYYLHMSPEFWTNPKTFQPERFLTPDGKTVKRNEASMAFGIGKRACVGESLARDAIFLFMTSIFHKFQVKLAPESEHVTVDSKPGFVLPPQDFKICIKKRF